MADGFPSRRPLLFQPPYSTPRIPLSYTHSASTICFKKPVSRPKVRMAVKEIWRVL